MAKKNKNSNSSTKKNYYLLFKQGLKSVFSSKVQFIVIFLLSIFSVTLLTSGLSSFNRLTSNKEEVFNQTEKFDYDYHYVINDQSKTDDPESKIYPLLDIQYAYSSSIGEDSTNNFYDLYYAGTNANGTLFDGIFSGANLDTYAGYYKSDYKTKISDKLKVDLYANLVSAITDGTVGSDSAPHEITIMTEDSLLYNYFKSEYSSANPLITDYFYMDNYLSFVSKQFTDWIFSIDKAEFDFSGNDDAFFKEVIIGDSTDAKYSNQITSFDPDDPKYDQWHGWAGDQLLTPDGYVIVDPINDEANNYQNYLENNATGLREQGLHGSISHSVHSDVNGNQEGGDIYKPFIDSESFISISGLHDFGDQVVSNDKTDTESFIYFHTKMAAEASGYDVNFRNEVYLDDYDTNFKFRIVALDENGGTYGYNDPNMTLYEGRLPWSPIQIVISPQFAKANNWQVGDWITVDQRPLQISGIGADPYSFVPTANNASTMPDISSSGVIYVPQTTIPQLLGSNAQDSVASTQQTHAFMTSVDGRGNANLLNRYLNIGVLGESNLAAGLTSQTVGLTSFDDSPYSKNWNYFSFSINTFKVIVYIASALTLIIALVSCFVSIKKNIERNSSQIAILKAMGTSNNFIAFSYLSYAFMITFVAIPIGWILGVVLQMPLCGFFDQFFSLNYHAFTFDIWPLFISLGTVGVVAFLCSYFSALSILNKPVMEVIHVQEKWSQNGFIDRVGSKLVAKRSFETRLRVKLVGSSTKNIWILVTVIFIASFMMTLVLSIPSVINNMSDVFFKDLNYKNQYDLKDPLYNSPLSKYQTTYVPPMDEFDDNYSENAGYRYLDMSGNLQYSGGYEDLNLYSDISGATTPIPYFEFDDTGTNVGWTYDDLRNNPGLTYDRIADFFGNNMYSGQGISFSSATIDGFLAGIYQQNYVIELSQGKSEQEALNDSVALTSSINDGIAAGIPQIMAQIFPKGSLPDDVTDWKTALMELILENAPAFVAPYVNQSPAREESFSFGWNYYNSQIEDDSLVTQYVNNFDNNTQISTVGLSKSNPIISTGKDTKDKLFIDNTSLGNLEQVADGAWTGGDITTSSGFKVYDDQSKTIFIPSVASQQTLVDLNKNTDYTGVIDQDFSVSGRKELQYKDKDNNFQPVNKSDWVYDDTDFYKSNYFKTSLTEEQKQAYCAATLNGASTSGDSDHAYLDPFSLSNASFSFKDEFDDGGSGSFDVKPNAFAKLESYGNSDSILLRPYYEFKNVKLFLPNAAEQTYQLNIDNIYDNGETTSWKSVVDENVTPPDFVKDTSPSANWTKISPYDLAFRDGYNSSDDGGLGNFFSSPDSWFTAVNYQSSSYATSGNNVWRITDESSPTVFNDKDVKVKYYVLDTADIYSSRNLYTGDDYSNLIYGYNTENYSQIMPSITDDSLMLSSGSPTDFSKEIVDNYAYEKLQGGANYWYNTSYSNVDEPIAFTTQAALNPTVNTGSNFVTAKNIDFNPNSIVIDSADLLSVKETYVNKISDIFIALTSFFIIFLVLCSTLLILLISNLFISKYYLFMNQMKAEGYSKKRILNLTLNNFTPFIIISWLLSFALSVGALFLINYLIFTSNGIVLPFGFNWYNGFIVLALIGVIYASAFLMAYIKLKKNPAELLTTKTG